jgi:hypothetical protein
MKSHALKYSAIASAALLAACGGGSSGDPAAPEPGVPPVVSVTPTTEPALEAATAFLAKNDALRATSIPATSAANFALLDGCFLTNGFGKSFIATEFDTDPFAVSSRQFDVGATRSNIKVLADRTIANADGSSRREIDVKWDTTFKDGTKFTALADTIPTETIISGSSAGSKLADGSACATSESKSDWRFYGNRKVINANVQAYNQRYDRTVLTTGLPSTPAIVYNKYIRFNVQDPANVAKYVTIAGPGIVAGTPAAPITLKMVSVRLLRDAPEFAGKNGNFVDWRDIDQWQFCRNATGGLASAETADCVTHGATTNNWGFSNFTAPATLDASFDTLGVVAGGEYTVKVYNDDGWKTVNGQASTTPIATYTVKLANLPFSAVALAGSAGVATDLFPKVTTNSMTPAQISTAMLAKAAFSMNLSWTAPGAMPDGKTLGWGGLFSFKQGRVNATQTAFNPASRQFDPTYPVANVTSASLPIPAAVAKLGLPTYMQYWLATNNRNGNNVESLYAFQ